MNRIAALAVSLAIAVLSCLVAASALAQAPVASAPPTTAAAAEGTPPSTSAAAAMTIPTGSGLPVLVNVSLFIVGLEAFDDVKGEFEATTDLRLRWRDTRLAFESKQVLPEYKEYRAREAEEQLAKLWQPNVQVINLLARSGYESRRLRIYADGQIEVIHRRSGRFRTSVDVTKFPFDEQSLRFDIVVRDQTTDDVMLQFNEDDERFSRAASDVRLGGWVIEDVDLDSSLTSGWNGDRYSMVTAGLALNREPTTGLTTIFIPLLASLLIPLLALWMNRATVDGFEVPAFELANMGIGGLFSVIALNFAVSSSYPTIAGSDNTVTRLFALNYASLAVCLAIMVALFRFNIVKTWLGADVQKELFRFIMWALPVLAAATSLAFILIAAA